MSLFNLVGLYLTKINIFNENVFSVKLEDVLHVSGLQRVKQKIGIQQMK